MSGSDALQGAGSAKQGACKHFRRDCTKNALDPASPLDQLYRQHASVSVPPPLQHINSFVTPIPHNIDSNQKGCAKNRNFKLNRIRLAMSSVKFILSDAIPIKVVLEIYSSEVEIFKRNSYVDMLIPEDLQVLEIYLT